MLPEKLDWVPVSKGMPNTLDRVLIRFVDPQSSARCHIVIAEYIAPRSVKEEDYIADEFWGMDGFCDYDEENDIYWAPSGFYEYQYDAEIHYYLSYEITHWARFSGPVT